MSCPNQYFNEDMRQGDVFYIEIEYDIDSNPIGFTHTFTMRETWDSPVALQVEETVGPVPAFGDDIYHVYIRIPPEKTALLVPGKYVWDLQVRIPDTTGYGNDDIVTLVPTPNNYNNRITVVPQVTEN
jgi:hypothetical protein